MLNYFLPQVARENASRLYPETCLQSKDDNPNRASKKKQVK